ncbi:hypothetical protein HPB52_021015 [Rhipicephalus sanguineus]|uniref:Uncharacterized protein n=1 Tax=Rhipicephalus sanguineus TaxID=34632 RepID=A0A9D4TBK9_RHISA|nr:hypothetical protein HPB52_021015 [Rhipicephalus sanguineus]
MDAQTPEKPETLLQRRWSTCAPLALCCERERVDRLYHGEDLALPERGLRCHPASLRTPRRFPNSWQERRKYQWFPFLLMRDLNLCGVMSRSTSFVLYGAVSPEWQQPITVISVDAHGGARTCAWTGAHITTRSCLATSPTDEPLRCRPEKELVPLSLATFWLSPFAGFHCSSPPASGEPRQHQRNLAELPYETEQGLEPGITYRAPG